MPAAAYWLPASDETPLYTRHWPCEKAIGAVMLAHGMAEHAGRYERLAAALNAAGYHLYAIDQRGHGQTANADELGHFADHGGWARWSAIWPA
ncbi:lysophospholipase [Pseudomonas aeruginosa]|nr:lysophospholipase [Pseudomonas aeruginosa]